MTTRFNLFTLIHKGLRHALQNMVWTAGKLDITNKDEKKKFFHEFRQIALMLHQHANDEDTFIQPLIDQCSPKIGQELEMQHQRSDKYLKELEKDVEAMANTSTILPDTWQLFVGNLNRFVGDYYLHLYHEEFAAMPVLWEAFNDEDLLAVSLKVRNNVPSHIQANFQRYMIPALNIQEQTMMLKNLKQTAPDPVFQDMCRLFETLLQPQEWSNVRAKLIK